MLPQTNHPLTRCYIAGARATTAEAMRSAMEIIRAIEQGLDQTTMAQCKLAAEILIERKQA